MPRESQTSPALSPRISPTDFIKWKQLFPLPPFSPDAPLLQRPNHPTIAPTQAHRPPPPPQSAILPCDVPQSAILPCAKHGGGGPCEAWWRGRDWTRCQGPQRVTSGVAAPIRRFAPPSGPPLAQGKDQTALPHRVSSPAKAGTQLTSGSNREK